MWTKHERNEQYSVTPYSWRNSGIPFARKLHSLQYEIPNITIVN